MLSASLIQLKYASKHWKSTFSYSETGGVNEAMCPGKAGQVDGGVGGNDFVDGI